MDKAEALLKEYDTLRQESLDSINNRSQIVSFGLAAVGVFAAAVFASERAAANAALVRLVFGIGVPAISLLILYIWLGEVERMMRAGEFMVALEQRINRELDPASPTLAWEGHLRSAGAQMKYPYLAVLVLFFGISVGSPVVAVLTVEFQGWKHWWVLALPWTGIFGVGCHIRARVTRLK